MKNDYESLKYKLLNILDDDNKNKNLKVLERFLFDVNQMYISDYKKDITEKIIESFLERKNLIIKYYNPNKDECIERRILPYTLTFYNGGWYLEAYCNLRKSKRLFRLDRIKEMEICDDKYEESSIDYFDKDNKSSDNMKVILEIDKKLFETIKNDNIFLNSEVKTNEDKVRLSLNTNRIDTLINLAIRNYNKVKIIEPQSIIDRLKNISINILEKY